MLQVRFCSVRSECDVPDLPQIVRDAQEIIDALDAAGVTREDLADMDTDEFLDTSR